MTMLTIILETSSPSIPLVKFQFWKLRSDALVFSPNFNSCSGRCYNSIVYVMRFNQVSFLDWILRLRFYLYIPSSLDLFELFTLRKFFSWEKLRGTSLRSWKSIPQPSQGRRWNPFVTILSNVPLRSVWYPDCGCITHLKRDKWWRKRITFLFDCFFFHLINVSWLDV